MCRYTRREAHATNLAKAKTDGYHIAPKMIPNMGYHFINPKITGFDVNHATSIRSLKLSHRFPLVALRGARRYTATDSFAGGWGIEGAS